MQKTLVTVVIPTRNRPELLKRAIASVLAQTCDLIEIVVVIDGSDDATHAALRAMANERLRFILLRESVGGSDARNIGVQNARSEWIAFLDDDDEWLPSKLEKQLALAGQATEPYPVIATQLIGKSPYGDFIWPRRFPAESEPVCEYLFNRKSFFTGEGQLQTSALLTRRSLMELIPFTSGLRKHQDIDWYLRVFQVPGVHFYFVPEPLVHLYVEENRETISNCSDWRFSLDWLIASRGRMTPRGYAGFICTIVASEASRQGQWRAIPELLMEMFRHGKPGFMDLSLFVGRWLIRRSIRGKLRGLRYSIAIKQPTRCKESLRKQTEESRSKRVDSLVMLTASAEPRCEQVVAHRRARSGFNPAIVMNNPRISVIIPTKNRPTLVVRAVSSVLRQTEQSFEVIVVLDGPDTSTEAALAQIDEQRLRVILLPDAGGAPAARNAGFAAARGDWVALLDDDDEWLPNKLEQQVKVAKTSPFPSPIIATGLIARSPLADFVWPRVAPKLEEPISEYLMVRSSLFAGEKILQTSTVMARRELFRAVPYAEGLRKYQDWDWLLRAVKEPGVGLEFIHEPLVVWHIEESRQAISSQNDWRFCFDWGAKNRHLLTKRAYASFLLISVSSVAARQKQWCAFALLLRHALVSKGGRLIDFVLFFGIWFVPAGARRKLRARFTSESRLLSMKQSCAS